jgi:5S rRNA maturation endonuclease (ribonuclease M5)
MEKSSIRDAAVKLQDWFLSSSTPSTHAVGGKGSTPKEETEKLVSEKKRELPTALCVVNKPLSFTLKDIDCTHPYVHSRGLVEDVAKLFGVGFFPGKGMMAGRCVIPIHNEVGELVAYAGRSIDATEPKYKLPTGFKKSHVLFNLHRATEVEAKGLIIVEGFFDCMKVQQAGLPFVVALMGSTMSDEQERLLVEHTGMVLLMLDGDDAGKAAAVAIAGRLMYKMFVKVINLADGKQPDQLSSDEIKMLLSI